MDTSSWFSRSQTARALELSGEQVRRLCIDGRLRCVRTPYGRLIDPLSVKELKEARERHKQPDGVAE